MRVRATIGAGFCAPFSHREGTAYAKSGPPGCVGETDAAQVPQQPGPAVRFGINPRAVTGRSARLPPRPCRRTPRANSPSATSYAARARRSRLPHRPGERDELLAGAVRPRWAGFRGVARLPRPRRLPRDDLPARGKRHRRLPRRNGQRDEHDPLLRHHPGHPAVGSRSRSAKTAGRLSPAASSDGPHPHPTRCSVKRTCWRSWPIPVAGGSLDSKLRAYNPNSRAGVLSMTTRAVSSSTASSSAFTGWGVAMSKGRSVPIATLSAPTRSTR